ncbi:MAG: ATP-dependent RNA helicase HrpA, partial [Pseudomonadales bacterium]|nr:ATP-dependent RNA helicase HrpA [Pseudomonadales bacterium]
DTLQEILQLEKEKKSVGDVLVFLSGEREIRGVGQKIRRSPMGDKLEVMPLYSRLSVAEQNRVFAPHQGRRVVLATNVAETSLTVPGIRYVIDTGLARISRYSVRSKVQQLPIEPISRASAEQRKGRCGRVSEGVCFRLYSEDDFESRPEFTPPEILRTNLASVILQMLVLRLGDISKFPFVERPDQRQINDGFQLLRELEAVDAKNRITRLGKDMARIPIDLRLARMLLAASKTGCLKEVLIIVSALSIQDPRDRPHDHQQAADEAHRRHWHDESDFMAFVNLWNFYEDSRQRLSQNRLRKFCREQFLSFLRMREWRDIHRQLHLLCREMNLKENHGDADYASIHRALLTGLLSNIGERGDENEYVGARNRKHYIFPGSSQFKSRPRWIVSAELVETTRLYARTVARIESDWIEPLARHLVKRSHYEPHFEAKRGQVLAFEEVSLYGLVIVKKRTVDFGAIDPPRAREIFIQAALVEQKLETDAAFFKHNHNLIREVEKLESKARKRDILVESWTLYRFYDERLPQNVCSNIDLEQWREAAERKDPRVLYLSRDYLMKQQAELSEELYPDTLEVADTKLKLDYHFDPQHEDDGVSIEVPVAILKQVSSARLDWIIPGLLREKCLALIRSLPKSLRKNFVPAPEYVDRIIDDLEYDGRPLTEVLAQKLLRESGVRVPAEAFDSGVLDRHLRLNIKVVDDSGKVIGRGRDLEALIDEFGGRAVEQFAGQSHEVTRDGLTDWDFESLPETVAFRQAGVE